MRAVILMLALIGSSFAQAEVFECQGVGRFANITRDPVTLNWQGVGQTAILNRKDLMVEIYLDKANTRTHYLGIMVKDIGENGLKLLALKGAKGSLQDMVQYQESLTDMITCVPVKQ